MGIVYECAPQLIGIYPVVTVNPMMPSILGNTALGTPIATISVINSDGSAFTGTLSFGPPNFSDGGVYAITGSSSPFSLIVNPSGPGVGNTTTIERVNVVASI